MFRLSAMFMALAALVAICPTAWAETFKVRFHVVDTDGKPVADAELATHWIIDSIYKMELKGVFDSKAITDADGNAQIEFDDYGRPMVLLGYSSDRKLGGFTVIDRQKEGTTIQLRFAPTANVTAKLVCSEKGSAPIWTNTIISLEEAPGYFFEYRSSDGQISFPFPEGDWNYRIYGGGIVGKRGEFKTVAGDDFSFEELDFELDALAKLVGKPAPKLDITEARGIDRDFDWSDYRGKWVMLEFWGFW